MKPEDASSIEAILSKMDRDCATRAVLSVLGGKKKFAEQFTIECGIMANRTRAKVEAKNTTALSEADLEEVTEDEK